MINTGNSAIMGESEKMLKHLPDPSNDLDWRSSVPDTNSTREIPLTKGKVAIVDAEDYEHLAQFKWFAQRGKNSWYARRTTRRADGKRVGVFMHRAILGLTDPKIQADHRDLNGLNNRHSNLRSCTQTQNLGNKPKRSTALTSKYKGVSRAHWGKPWSAAIKFRRKTYHLGAFAEEKQAALAYDAAAKIHFGEFAVLNFPEQKVSRD